MTELIVEAADGQDDKAVLQWLYTDQSIKSVTRYSESVEAAAERKLMPTLIAAGKLSQDSSGIYHKV